MQTIKFRKIKDFRKVKKMPSKTEAQRIASSISGTKNFLQNNPMKNPAIAKKNALKRKGKISSPQTLFQKGNKYWMRVNPQSRILQGRRLGMNNLGRKTSKLQKEKARGECLKNNPMKNPKYKKRMIASLKKTLAKKKEKAQQQRQTIANIKRRHHPNCKLHHFKKGHIPWNKKSPSKSIELKRREEK